MKSKELSDVEGCALEWFTSKRPLTYAEIEHLANPEINCVEDAEKRLARAVQRMVIDDDEQEAILW